MWRRVSWPVEAPDGQQPLGARIMDARLWQVSADLVGLTTAADTPRSHRLHPKPKDRPKWIMAPGRWNSYPLITTGKSFPRFRNRNDVLCRQHAKLGP
jgi:hypothetical protein